MVQEMEFELGFWERVERMRERIFSEQDLELLELIKPNERAEERLARL